MRLYWEWAFPRVFFKHFAKMYNLYTSQWLLFYLFWFCLHVFVLKVCLCLRILLTSGSSESLFELFMFTTFYLLQDKIFVLQETFYQIVYMKDFKDHSQLKFWILTNWLSIQKQPSRVFPLRECSVSVQRIYREALIRRCGFNKVAYAALWGSLFHMSGLLWLFFCICRTLFSGGNASKWLFLAKHLSLVTQFL